MSYDIYIGNAELDYCAEDDYPYVDVQVAEAKHPDAPTFPGDGMTGNGNSRHPGYSAWADFTKKTGIHELFYDENEGLLRPHPGTRVLLPKHVQAVEVARKAWEKSHPDSKPGWCCCQKCDSFMREKHDEHRDLDAFLARLLWLEWWMKWAIKNCQRPAINNH